MIKKQIQQTQYVLEPQDINIIKGALEYCKHRLLKHGKASHLTVGDISRLLSEFYE